MKDLSKFRYLLYTSLILAIFRAIISINLVSAVLRGFVKRRRRKRRKLIPKKMKFQTHMVYIPAKDNQHFGTIATGLGQIFNVNIFNIFNG